MRRMQQLKIDFSDPTEAFEKLQWRMDLVRREYLALDKARKEISKARFAFNQAGGDSVLKEHESWNLTMPEHEALQTAYEVHNHHDAVIALLLKLPMWEDEEYVEACWQAHKKGEEYPCNS
jgi:hypothetical protein